MLKLKKEKINKKVLEKHLTYTINNLIVKYRKKEIKDLKEN